MTNDKLKNVDWVALFNQDDCTGCPIKRGICTEFSNIFDYMSPCDVMYQVDVLMSKKDVKEGADKI
jgi:hypothetical protein